MNASTVDPAPDRNAPSAPASRAAPVSRGSSGYDADRYGSWSRSTVRSASSSKRPLAIPATPIATRPRFSTAWRSGTSVGSTRRITSVDSRRSGMNSTHRSPAGESKRTAATRSARCAETTNPPSSTAAALSGCVSITVAIWSSASGARTSPTRALPATTPPTVAAADEPSPRDRGTSLCIATRQPMAAGRGPRVASRTLSRPAMNRLSRVAGSSPAPSPVTSSSIDPGPPGSSTASTVTRLVSSSASPRQS